VAFWSVVGEWHKKKREAPTSSPKVDASLFPTTDDGNGKQFLACLTPALHFSLAKPK
jgi:hypothetical protein